MKLNKSIKMIVVSIVAASLLLACSDKSDMRVGKIGGSPQVAIGNIDPGVSQTCDTKTDEDECKNIAPQQPPVTDCDKVNNECIAVGQVMPSEPVEPVESMLTSSDCKIQIPENTPQELLEAIYMTNIADVKGESYKNTIESKIDPSNNQPQSLYVTNSELELENSNLVSNLDNILINYAFINAENVTKTYYETNITINTQIRNNSHIQLSRKIEILDSLITINIFTSHNNNYVSALFEHSKLGTKAVLFEKHTDPNCPTYAPIWIK